MAYSALARRLKFLIASWRRHGLGHVAEVFRQARVRNRWTRSPRPPLDPDRLPALLGSGTQSKAVATLKASVADLFPGITRTSPEALTRALSIDGFANAVREDAAGLRTGKFSALGLCINDPDGFDWSRDYGSGKRWPNVPGSSIRYLDDDGSDVKYPWELSRMYWIGWLGQAWRIDRDDASPETFAALVDDWSEKNPFNTGVNWSIAMEAAIRAFWLAAGGALFAEAEIDDAWWSRYYALLFNHGLYIENNLEYFPNLTNHYIANCLGLVAVGAVFRDAPDGRRWLEEGWRRMQVELRRQTTSDGVNYERSIGYHGLVLEMYLIAAAFSSRAGLPFDPASIAIVERMVDFTRCYADASGPSIPQLGDSDDGVILRMRSDQNLYDHRWLPGLARCLLRNDTIRVTDERPSPQAALLGDPDDIERFAGSDAAPASPMKSEGGVFPEGGFAILRNDHLSVFADVGPIGLHGNNDTLSFTLSSDGVQWFVDPGTGCYTRDRALRNALRSTAAHNTPCVDGTEIAQFDGLWRVKDDRTQTRILENTLGTASGVAGTPLRLAAEHHAYRNRGAGVVVRRTWSLESGEVRIGDEFIGDSSPHDVSVRFTLSDRVRAVRKDDRNVDLVGIDSEGNEKSMLFHCSIPFTVAEGCFSPSYGLLVPTTQITVSTTITAPAKIDYLCRLYPRA